MMNPRRQRQKRQNEQTPANVFVFRFPQDVFERMGGKLRASEVEWTCSTCGETPAPKRCANGFLPGKCSCQKAQEEQAKEQRELEDLRERRRILIRANRAECFGWVGGDWDIEEIERMTFANFNSKVQTKALVTCLNFAKALRGNLVLYTRDEVNSFGTGKTHLATAICNYVLETGCKCHFTTAQGLFDAFGARMGAGQDFTDLEAKASQTPLLVIDDLDKVYIKESENGSSFKKTRFFEILDKRYKRGLPTVFTTNKCITVTHNDVIGLSEYIGKAAASRLCDEAKGGLKTEDMSGEDYRRRKLEDREV